MAKAKKIDPPKEVKYPEIKVYQKSGKNAMKVEEAKKLLGWKEDTEEAPFTDYVDVIETPSKRRVVLTNNTRNRPLDKSQLAVLTQEHLQGNWKMNPDGIGIGQCEAIMSGQHRLISFILAESARSSNTEEGAEWRKKWPNPLTMDCILITGLDESDETFRILNTGVPASVSDVLYRQGLFEGRKSKQREKLCEITQKTLELLWKRTQASKNSSGFTNLQTTNSEYVDLLQRHPRILDCVIHISEEYDSEAGKGASKRIGPSTCATFLYLMGASESKWESYEKKGYSEKGLDWSWWDQASDFVTSFISADGEFQVLRDVLSEMTDPDDPLAGGENRKYTFIKAWNLHKQGTEITEKGIKLKTVKKEGHDELILDERPVIGGIDLGQGKDSSDNELQDPGVTEEEVEEAKEQILGEKIEPVKEEDSTKKILTDLQNQYPGHVFLFETPTEYIAWENDATLLGNLMNCPPKRYPNGLMRAAFNRTAANLAEAQKKFKAAKKKLLLMVKGPDGKPVPK